MRKTYKEIFNDVKPDNEVLEFAVNSAEMKDISMKKIIAFALSFVFIIAGTGLGVMLYKNADMKETVNIPVAYETKGSFENEKHIASKITGKRKTVIIDADVVVEGKIKEMCIYKAEYTEQSVEKTEELLYGENGLFWGQNKRKSSVMPILQPRGTGIIFETEPKAVNIDKYLEKIIRKELKENQITCCEISYSEARKIADLFLDAGEFENYCFNKGNVIPISTQGGKNIAGCYEIQYYQYADGFPLETVSPDVYNGVASDLNIRVDDDGIAGLRICGLDLSVKQELNGKIMNVEDAIKLTEQKLDELWFSEYAPIVEIRLEYLLDELADGSMELVPCWHFCIDETELKHQSIEIQRANDTNDLCVNAVTGEMYRVGNRYPVYQISDGSIVSAWNKK